MSEPTTAEKDDVEQVAGQAPDPAAAVAKQEPPVPEPAIEPGHEPAPGPTMKEEETAQEPPMADAPMADAAAAAAGASAPTTHHAPADAAADAPAGTSAANDNAAATTSTKDATASREATASEHEDENMDYHSSSGSEFEPEPESPKPKPKSTRAPRTPRTPAVKTPKTPISRVKSGRVEKSASATPGDPSTPNQASNLRCPVQGCGQTFTGRNPRQSLWHHLKYYATRGLPDKAEFEKAHGEAHAAMKREAEPKGTPVERNRISSSDYRKKNPEKAKTSARLSNFRARARKKGLTGEKEIEDMVNKWEKEWQEKQAKEASEYFSGILLSAFE